MTRLQVPRDLAIS